MRIFTGDESGLVKSIIIPAKEEKKEERRKRAKTDNKKEEEPTPTTVNFGTVNKDEAVQKLTWGVLDGAKQIVVARKSGKIQYLSPEDGSIVREYKDPRVGVDDSLGSFVGLTASDSHLVACSSTGHVSYTPLSSYSSSQSVSHIASLGDNLNVMRVHPTQPQLFATGGKERDLCIYDINVMTSPGDAEPSGESAAGNSEKRKKAQTAVKGLVFQAKNVKNDFLNLRVPIWIRDLQFMNEEGTKVATATHYHQIRLYDTKAARRPVLDVEIGKNPLTSIHVGTDFNYVLYTDTMSNVGTVDIRTGKTVGHYKGFSGCVTDVCVSPPPTFTSASQDPQLISVSMDRFLRIHEMTSVNRKLQTKLYLKQRLTCVLLDESYDAEIQKKHKEESDEEEEALWNTMDTVADKPKRKRD